ncbi:hypothetical protein POM88_040373 [Heracleum sosnowskyi]|uniref:Uncharacterized protein n=1 Tax=Heracleum sosnowskyi TaxID=360622 RepID=A0AAD8HEW3_9APIA|nr:hypothetical protein POM88_040373 [Heracleum sosnowskyi]
MYLVEKKEGAIACMLLVVFFLGTWPALLTLLERRGRLPQHTYLDYTITNLLAAVINAFTFGEIGKGTDQNPNFSIQLSQSSLIKQRTDCYHTLVNNLKKKMLKLIDIYYDALDAPKSGKEDDIDEITWQTYKGQLTEKWLDTGPTDSDCCARSVASIGPIPSPPPISNTAGRSISIPRSLPA